MLSVFITFGLYILFLGDMMANNYSQYGDTRFLMDSWIMAGIVGVTSISTTLGAYGIMIDDEARFVLKDLYSAPLKRRTIAAGYIVSSFVIGVIMCAISLVCAELYIVSGGGELLSALTVLKIFGIMLLAVLSSSALILFIVSFLRSQSAFGVASTIIGTIIGFLCGIYIPIGVLPEGVQAVIKFFPPAHAVTLFRNLMMEAPMKELFVNVPTEYVSDLKENLGLYYKIGNYTTDFAFSVTVLIVSTLLFYGLGILMISRKKKK
jgi:multidrug/hemolysin transport system permease protein